MQDEVERAWAEVIAGWDDEDRHKRFLVLADAHGRLADAGRRYREVKDRDPARSAEAERRIDEVLSRALARMKLDHPRETAPRRRVEWIAFGVSAALIAAALWQLLR